MRRKIFRILIFVFVLISVSGRISATQSESKYEKAEVIGSPEIIVSSAGRIQKINIVILSGKYKGLMAPVDNYIWDYEGYNMLLSEGDKLTLKIVKDYDGSLSFLVMGRYRSPYIFMALVLFIVVFFIITGFKNKWALLMIAFNIIVVLPLLIFIIRTGFNPFAAGIIICGAGIFISAAVILGGGKKFYAASAGSVLGVSAAGVLTLIFLDYMHIEGMFSSSARMILVASRYLKGWNVGDLKGVVAAGIMIASLGAIIDIAVSIVSAMNRIYLESSKSISSLILFKSGLNVGRDMVATMLNSLVLVFTGLSLPVLMVLGIMDIPFIKIINFEFVLITILSAVISSLALMITVPVTAYISSRVLRDD